MDAGELLFAAHALGLPLRADAQRLITPDGLPLALSIAQHGGGGGLLALGAGLGIAGAATRPQTPAAAADTSTARNLAPRSNNSGSSVRDLAPVTVVLSSLVPAGPSDAQRARNGLRDARRRGFADGNYAPRRIEH